MVEREAERLVVLATAGVDDSWKQIPWSSRLLFRSILRNLFADHHALEAIRCCRLATTGLNARCVVGVALWGDGLQDAE